MSSFLTEDYCRYRILLLRFKTDTNFPEYWIWVYRNLQPDYQTTQLPNYILKISTAFFFTMRRAEKAAPRMLARTTMITIKGITVVSTAKLT